MKHCTSPKSDTQTMPTGSQLKLWVKNPCWLVIGYGLLTNFLDGGPKGRLLPMGPLFFGANETSGSVIP